MRWTIETTGENESGKSVLAAQHDDEKEWDGKIILHKPTMMLGVCLTMLPILAEITKRCYIYLKLWQGASSQKGAEY